MNANWIKLVLVLQAITAALFVIEFLNTVFGIVIIRLSWEIYEMIEMGILLSLFIGMGLSAYLLQQLNSRNEKIEDQLKLASGEFAGLVDQKFEQWALSKAEKEVAMLNLKGFTVPEIAGVLGKSEGTIKAQNAAIYRKSGMSGRTQLIVSFVEDMVDQTLDRGLET